MMDQSADTASHGRVGYGRMARFTPLILAVIMIAAVGFIALNDRDKDVKTSAVIGNPAPNLTLTSLDGEQKYELASLSGNVVVLNFWASWCTPCKTEMPAFEAVHLDGASDVRIIGVDIKNDKVDAALALLAETGVTYPIALDSGGDHQLYGPIEQGLGIGGSYPVTVFISPSGVVDSIKIGELKESEIRDAIAEARS